MVTGFIIKYQRAIGYLRLIRHEQVVNHLVHYYASRRRKIIHLMEVNTIQHQSRREYYLPFATNNQVAIVGCIPYGS